MLLAADAAVQRMGAGASGFIPRCRSGRTTAPTCRFGQPASHRDWDARANVRLALNFTPRFFVRFDFTPSLRRTVYQLSSSVVEEEDVACAGRQRRAELLLAQDLLARAVGSLTM